MTPPDQGLSPLLAVANRLLMLAPQLRATRSIPDMAQLHASLAEGLQAFESRASAEGIAPERASAARYVLCTVLDEAAANTPWGGFGMWAPHSLLMRFHNEADGGDRVFKLMARLAEKPDLNLDLLELIYAAIALGFQGRYRQLADGPTQLEAIRARLAQIVQTQRGDHAEPLALRWRGRAISNRATRSLLPLALTAALCGLLLLGVYVWLSLTLSAGADVVYGDIQALRLAAPAEPPALPAAVPRIASGLQADLMAGVMSLREESDRSVVTLHAEPLFAADGFAVSPDGLATLARLATALAHTSGDVQVTVFHDDQPLSPSANQPSVWHFTEARAHAVADVLIKGGVAPERIQARGRADTEPLVPNDTAGNRAINRRVEVTLLVPRGPSTRASAPP